MADETKVDETTEQDATVEENVVEEEVDFDKELETAAKKAQNIAGYESRHKNDESTDDDLAKRVAAELFPKLQATAEQSAVEVNLERVSNGNQSLKKLIKFHLENTVNPNLPLSDRIDAAYAIANKKVIEKTTKEINIARQNRSQISNTSQGQSQEVHQKPGQNVLSDAQIEGLKKFHQTNRIPGSFDKFLENTIKSMAR